MPELGEITSRKEHRFIWHACIDCGKQRWVQFTKNQIVSLRCPHCNNKRTAKRGSDNHWWKGGRSKTGLGYVTIQLTPDDFFYLMADHRGRVLEHRLVVAKALGRNLHSWEIVHHKHAKYPAGSIEDKQDNRYPENLQLVQEMQHKQLTRFENKINKLLEEQKELKQEIRLLRWQIMELTKQENKGKKQIINMDRANQAKESALVKEGG